ncbi:MAG: transglutaminase-like domain-containing protein [Candidatus Helarchaeota archaeon]
MDNFKEYIAYLKEDFNLEIDNPNLQDLNKKIIASINKNDKKEIAKTLFEWVRDNIQYKIIEIVGALGTYNRGSGACVDKSSLLISLLRINNIPARYILLRAFFTNTIPIKQKYVDHCAVEAFIKNKWAILDPTFDPRFDNIFSKSEFGAPNWWDIKKSKIFEYKSNFSSIETRLISKSYQIINEWKIFIDNVIKNKN